MTDYKDLIKILREDRVKRDELMAKHTTFGIGGPADLFYEAKTTEELARAVNLARELKVPFLILGGGSNLLISDNGFRGMVIKIKNSKLKIKNCIVSVDAGVLLERLVGKAVEQGLSGLEFAAGIPGTVGGAVRGNAGAWQQSIGEKILRVKVLTSDGKIEWIDWKDCQFGYRQSRFKKRDEVVLEVELKLEKKDKSGIKRQIRRNLEKRQLQPKGSSAGCIFINPKPDSAGRLIDECGLKGKKIGEAQISFKHANFVINLGKAKANDVVRLIKLAKKEVKKKFGIGLKEEICFVGFGRIGNPDLNRGSKSNYETIKNSAFKSRN